MNTSARARHVAGGFSFVELLVTIIIAGIAFAAMVPLFVQAQGQNSADQARNIALQVAQDKIERVRQLGYDQITQANLDSSTYPSAANAQFGKTWDFVRNGSTKRYTIQYTVSPVLSATGQEKYKKVQVRVTWTAPPAPVKAAVLQTLVYRQYAGPEIRSVTVGLPSIFDVSDPDVTLIIGSPVVIDVELSPESIPSMNASDPDPARRGWVKFTVSPYTGGGTIAAQEVSEIYSNQLGHYQYVWDNSAAEDGIYKFEMTAVSANGMQGSTATISYNVALLTPPAPKGLVALPGNGQVSVSWAMSGIGDFHHWELWRGTASGGETLYKASLTNPSYTDTPLANDGTTYYYRVVVVDKDGHRSSFSAEVSATPAVQADTVAPRVPTNLTAVKQPNTGTINLAWTESTDDLGTPATGVLGYVIERSPNGASGWVQLQGSYPNLIYPDSSAGWSSTWYYHVAAIDNAGNTSAFSARVGPVTTDAQLRYSLTVSNTTGVVIYVWVQNVGTGQWFAQNGTASAGKPSGVTLNRNGTNSTKIWGNLPSGVYNVYASTAVGGTPALPSKSGSGDLTAGNNTISF
jgi:type II secretory pathway pseudopilin PulG